MVPVTRVIIVTKKEKKSTILTKSRGNSEQPTWSPDGRFLAYRHNGGSETNIYIQRLGSTKVRKLSFFSGGGTSPNWGPHGVQ